jgi:hypothetical protein
MSDVGAVDHHVRAVGKEQRRFLRDEVELVALEALFGEWRLRWT